MKILLDELRRKSEFTEERISELENRLVENIPKATEKQRLKEK
jgi:hypothetical protein